MGLLLAVAKFLLNERCDVFCGTFSNDPVNCAFLPCLYGNYRETANFSSSHDCCSFHSVFSLNVSSFLWKNSNSFPPTFLARKMVFLYGVSNLAFLEFQKIKKMILLPDFSGKLLVSVRQGQRLETKKNSVPRHQKHCKQWCHTIQMLPCKMIFCKHNVCQSFWNAKNKTEKGETFFTYV